MEISSILTSGIALIFVLCLIGLASVLLRKINNKMELGGTKDGNRVEILEIKRIDTKNKLVLFKIDEQEHIILVSNDGNLNIPAKGKSEKNK